MDPAASPSAFPAPGPARAGTSVGADTAGRPRVGRIARHSLSAWVAATGLAILASLLPLELEPDYARAAVVGVGCGVIAVLLGYRLGTGDANRLGEVFGLYWMGVALLQLAVWMGFHLWWCGTLVDVAFSSLSRAADPGGSPAEPGKQLLPFYLVPAALWSIPAMILGAVKGIRWNLPGGRPGTGPALLSAALAVPAAFVLLWVAGYGAAQIDLGFAPESMAFAGFGVTLGTLLGHARGCAARDRRRTAEPGGLPPSSALDAVTPHSPG